MKKTLTNIAVVGAVLVLTTGAAAACNQKSSEHEGYKPEHRWSHVSYNHSDNDEQTDEEETYKGENKRYQEKKTIYPCVYNRSLTSHDVNCKAPEQPKQPVTPAPQPAPAPAPARTVTPVSAPDPTPAPAPQPQTPPQSQIDSEPAVTSTPQPSATPEIGYETLEGKQN